MQSHRALRALAFPSPHALLLTQTQAVGDHGDELGVRGLALYIRHGVAEKLL